MQVKQAEMSSWRRVESVGVDVGGAGVVVFLGRGIVSPWKGVMGLGEQALLRERFPTAEHPTLRLNLPEPVSHRGNPAEVFEDVLLADEPDWKNPAGRERDRAAEEGLQLEDAL
jgi:hypothetical protein